MCLVAQIEHNIHVLYLCSLVSFCACNLVKNLARPDQIDCGFNGLTLNSGIGLSIRAVKIEFSSL